MTKIVAGIAAFALAGCASISSNPTTHEVVEGDPAAYPAFEEAARSCSFQGIQKVSNGQGGSHFLIAYTDRQSVQTRCLLDWLKVEANGRLFRSGH